MKIKKIISLAAALIMLLSLCACGESAAPAEKPASAGFTVTDMVGREVDVVPGS